MVKDLTKVNNRFKNDFVLLLVHPSDDSSIRPGNEVTKTSSLSFFYDIERSAVSKIYNGKLVTKEERLGPVP